MKEYILITLATIPYAIGIALFLDPNDLAPGGLTGISILVNRLTGIDTGSLFFILNIPILLLGMWKFGGKFISFYPVCACADHFFYKCTATI